MKKTLLLNAVLTLALTARATLVINYDSGTINQVITDGNPTGLALSQTFSGLDNGPGNEGINNVDVHLNITGGFNGDLYGYLVLQSTDGSTLTSILLNRVGRNDASGFGYDTSGFGNITLSGSGLNIHDVTTPAGGTYQADGRNVNPNGDFSAATPMAQLDVFNTRNVNGTWTLFLADMVSGDQSMLVSWGLDVSVVPEPATWALLVFGVMFVVFSLIWRRAIVSRMANRMLAWLGVV
ncbi:MAG: PEP-CTERM sorting domain-containing protein [Verrucomicrobia bacterium]|nr:PEP-CTERM sorting domain-containing protein [Verrucomicrobiota bacterium]